MGANTPLARWIPTSDPNTPPGWRWRCVSWRVAGGLLRSNSSFNFSSNADAEAGGGRGGTFLLIGDFKALQYVKFTVYNSLVALIT